MNHVEHGVVISRIVYSRVVGRVYILVIKYELVYLVMVLVFLDIVGEQLVNVYVCSDQ